MSKLDEKTLQEIAYYGSLAPSVHNIQPWEFSIENESITIQPSSVRTIDAGDPVGRQTWISIGACAENMIVAAENLGFATTIEQKGKSIKLCFTRQKHASNIPLAAIKKRYTDRSVYSGKALEKAKLAEIQGAANIRGIQTVVTDDTEIIKLVGKLVAKGISMALSNPAFRTELSEYINKPGSKRKVGISAESLLLNQARGRFEALKVRKGLGVKNESKSELESWGTAPALILTFSDGDAQKDWFNAGRAYQRAGLTATHLGLQQATSAAVVEALDFHEDVERKIGTKKRLQTVMRIGNSTAKPAYSPRIDVADLIVTK